MENDIITPHDPISTLKDSPSSEMGGAGVGEGAAGEAWAERTTSDPSSSATRAVIHDRMWTNEHEHRKNWGAVVYTSPRTGGRDIMEVGSNWCYMTSAE